MDMYYTKNKFEFDFFEIKQVKWSSLMIWG